MRNLLQVLILVWYASTGALSVPAFADVEFAGVRIPCAGCTQEGTERCVATRPTADDIPCDSLLFDTLAQRPQSLALTDAQALLSFILDSAPVDKRVSLYTWLFDREEAEAVVVRQLPRLLAANIESFAEALVQSKRGSAIAAAIWQAASVEGLSLPDSLLAAVSSLDVAVSLPQFLSRLKADEIHSLEALRVGADGFRRRNDLSAADQCAIIATSLEQCTGDLRGCLRRLESPALLPESKAFIGYQIEAKLRDGLANGTIAPEVTLEILATLRTSLARDIGLRSHVLAATQHVLESKFPAERVAFLREEYSAYLQREARHDPVLNATLAELFAVAAKEAVERGEPEAAIHFLGRSYGLSSGDMPIRNSALQLLQANATFRGNSALQRRLQEAVGAEVEVVPGSGLNALLKKALMVVVGLVVLYLVCLGLFFRDKVKERKEEFEAEQTLAAWKDSRERRELLHFFSLQPNATMDELNKAYRRMAKEFHPDTMRTGSEKHFTQLQEHYERAKVVLFAAADDEAE